MRDRNNRDPLSFTIAEWQQAKRVQQDTKLLKVTFQECWAVSDNAPAFAQALQEKGFLLARGDRRGYVALDYRGEVYSLSRWTGASSKALKSKLGDPASLPDVAAAKDQIARRMTEKLKAFIRETEARANAKVQLMLQRKTALKTGQRTARETLRQTQRQRADQEAICRAARFRSGVRGLWDWVTGKTRTIRKENELDAARSAKRDATERETLVATQLSARGDLQRDLRETRRDLSRDAEALRLDIAFYGGWRTGAVNAPGNTEARNKARPSARVPEL